MAYSVEIEYSRNNQSKFLIKFHIIFVCKCRKKVLAYNHVIHFHTSIQFGTDIQFCNVTIHIAYSPSRNSPDLSQFHFKFSQSVPPILPICPTNSPNLSLFSSDIYRFSATYRKLYIIYILFILILYYIIYNKNIKNIIYCGTDWENLALFLGQIGRICGTDWENSFLKWDRLGEFLFSTP